MNQTTVSCDLHDYIEIACMYGYRVKLTLKDRQVLDGKAVDILTSTDKREYLVIDNGKRQNIELNQLKKLNVLTPNAQFTEVTF